MDCGPTCLRMVAKYYGRTVSLEYLRCKSEYGKQGVSMLGLADTAESIGLKVKGAKIGFEELINDAPLPAILHWQSNNHFVVLMPGSTKSKLMVADPATGQVTLNKEDFLNNWISIPAPFKETEQACKGMVLLFEATPEFKEMKKGNAGEKHKRKINGQYLFGYIKQHKTDFFKIILCLLIGSGLQLVFPYLTKSVVDKGISTRDINFIQLVLVAQLMLLFSQSVVEFIRSRILLHISTKINISLLSDFWAKLLKLPMQFFDSKHPGDIIQRIGDHHRIENFLTGTALTTFFSLFTLAIFSVVLFNYHVTIFIIFAAGSILYILWVWFFLKYRRRLDYQRFAIAAKENNATMQLVFGMQEIKLNNAEDTYRLAWESLQAGVFKLNFKNLSLTQYQQIGALVINQGKNIVITFIVAKLVIEGSLTLGTMLAIQYIIGQLNGPIEQLVGFSQQAQYAKIFLERLNDIHSLEDEEAPSKSPLVSGGEPRHDLPKEHSIIISNLSFTYPGAGNEPVLKNINLTIPQNKVTAIVGMSGSGKTTLVKLLLRFYENYEGEIFFEASSSSLSSSQHHSPFGEGTGVRFKSISPKFWRSKIGAVMQDSFIFNDTIRRNITVVHDTVDEERLLNACITANILPFILSLPLGFNTKLGAESSGISGGQKQRIAIARAVYKNPEFIFLDEATNSLDANNEKVILENLQDFFNGKTIVVVAHRLSTVKNADKIVVLEDGEIVKEGTHAALALMKGKYYELVKNQLELGN